jgi:hypothetical protein
MGLSFAVWSPRATRNLRSLLSSGSCAALGFSRLFPEPIGFHNQKSFNRSNCVMQNERRVTFQGKNCEFPISVEFAWPKAMLSCTGSHIPNFRKGGASPSPASRLSILSGNYFRNSLKVKFESAHHAAPSPAPSWSFAHRNSKFSMI